MPNPLSKVVFPVGAVALFTLGASGGWLLKPVAATGSVEEHHGTTEAATAAGRVVTSHPSGGYGEAFEPKDFHSRVHNALSIRNRGKRERALRDAAGDLDSAEIQDALKAMESSRIPHRDEVIAQLFARWGEIDPSAAMVAAQVLANFPAQRAAVNSVLGAWVEKDAASAERWVVELPEGMLKNSAWDTLVSGIAVGDPKHALSLASERDFSWAHARTIAKDIFDVWVGANPQEAAVHALQLAPGELRTAALRAVANEWARVNVREALAWADSLPDQDYEVKPMNSFGLSPIYGVLNTWIDMDSAAAVSWIAQLPEGEKKAALAASACTFLSSATANPQVTMQLLEMLPEGPRRSQELQSFAHQIARWEPSAALEWVRQQSDTGTRQVIMSGLLSHLSGDHLLSALEYAKTLDPSDRENLISIQSRNSSGWTSMWNLADPATLAAWAERQPNNQEYLNRIASSWTQKDPERATEWLQGLPAQAKDTALSGIIEGSLSRVPIDTTYDTARHFQNAERWILQLSDPQARQSAYEKLAKRWLEMEPDFARAWINSSPLPPSVRERLLK